MNDKGKAKKYCVVILVKGADEFGAFLEHSNAFCNDESVQTIVLDRSIKDDRAAEFDVENAALKNGMEYHRIDGRCSIAQSYNRAFEWIDAEFVCFTDAAIYYDADLIRGIDKALYDMPLHKIAMSDYMAFNDVRDQEITELGEEEKPFPTKFILNDRESVYLFPYSYFFSYELIGNTRFKDVCEEESAIMFLMEMLEKVDSVAFAEGYRAYYTDAINYDPEEFYGCRNKDFYLKSLKENHLPFIEKYAGAGRPVPTWLQKSIIHILFFKIFSNYQVRDKLLLSKEETEEFFSYAGHILQYIDDKNLIRRTYYKKKFVILPIIYLLTYLKYKGNLEELNREFHIKKNTLYFSQRGIDINLQNEQRAVIQAINKINNVIQIDGYFHTDMLYQYKSDAIFAEVNGEKYDVEHTDIYSYEQCFGSSIDRKYSFHLDLNEGYFVKNNSKICFCIELDGVKIKLPMVFSGQPARLYENYRNSYWLVDKSYYLKYESPYINVVKATKKQLKFREKELLEEIKVKEKYNPESKNIIELREAYWKAKLRLGKKKIWIHYDKMYKAGDNGEYLFRYNYIKSQKDGTDCYFVISPEADDYSRLKSEFGEHILEYGSNKCRLYALCAQAVITTSQGVFDIVGFNSNMEFALRDLFNCKIINISHGVTMQRNADSQNRLKDNVMLYTTSSKYETEFISKPVYGYDETKGGYIALTGMARFDGLKDKSKKQILITPTWRPHLTEKLENRVTRKKFNKFKETEYYRIYNKLINDKRLIGVAKEYEYKIIFLIHTGMTAQADDYDKNESVEILRAGKDIDYETVLRESRLMVTDYSGVQYDFAYMKKPVIYYQPNEIPPRLKNGAMDYETMGFGPVITEYDDVVDRIIKYMKDGCPMKPEYINRVEDFFEYMDFENCKRLHDTIKSFVQADH